MFSSTRSINGVSKPRQPRRLNGFARVILVLAWAAFWFNTALFPCSDAVAAVFGGYSDEGSQPVSAAQLADHSDENHSECSDRSTSSSCGCNLNAGPVIDGVYPGLPTDRVYAEWFTIDVSVTAGLTAVNHFANLAPREYQPPPPFRVYLRTQRLLI